MQAFLDVATSLRDLEVSHQLAILGHPEEFELFAGRESLVRLIIPDNYLGTDALQGASPVLATMSR